MKKSTTLRIFSGGFILLSACSILSISVLAFFDPQGVMDLVGVTLPNTDAFSSIRGVYGGVGLTLFLTMLYTLRKNVVEGLGLLTLLWGLYAVSRIITIFSEGTLGAFGNKWLLIETVFFAAALVLLLLNRQGARSPQPARI